MMNRLMLMLALSASIAVGAWAMARSAEAAGADHGKQSVSQADQSTAAVAQAAPVTLETTPFGVAARCTASVDRQDGPVMLAMPEEPSFDIAHVPIRRL